MTLVDIIIWKWIMNDIEEKNIKRSEICVAEFSYFFQLSIFSVSNPHTLLSWAIWALISNISLDTHTVTTSEMHHNRLFSFRDYDHNLVSCLCASNQPRRISIRLNLSPGFRPHTRLPITLKGFCRHNRNFEDQFKLFAVCFKHSQLKCSPVGKSIWHFPCIIYASIKIPHYKNM